MNNINVTVELCAEDRARLDKLLEALTARPAEVKAAPEQPVEPEVVEPEVVEPVQETLAEPEQPVEPEVVTVTAADIQRKVIELSAAGKKAQVRDIVTTYADKVSELPESALPEVWAKLTALEG